MTTTLATLPKDAGTWRETDDGLELRYERRLRHSPDKVWKAIATPEGIACWFAIPVAMETRAGGQYNLRFNHPVTDTWTEENAARVAPNTILTYDPPRLFEHTFGEGHVVRWELEPDGDGTWLVMTHRTPARDRGEATGYLSGWQQHLKGLEAAIAGQPTPWNWDGWRELKAAYDERFEAG